MAKVNRWLAASFTRNKDDPDRMVTLKVFDQQELRIVQHEYHTSLRLAVLKFLNETKPAQLSMVESWIDENHQKEITVYYKA